LRAALETLKCFKIRGKKGVVFGDMLELGPQSQELHREIGVLLSELMFDFVIATGPLSAYAAEEALKNGVNTSSVYTVKDSAEAGSLCRKLASAGDMILVKGSRVMKMEKVFECFTASSTL
jgi:UDP-N-acetylmuramoyl-tripeptide--D-alanyl-D-alanine ligase